MRCLLCERWTCFGVLCSSCQPKLKPSIRLVDEMSVYSFYALSDVELLLHYKYTPIGSRVFASLAKEANRYFQREIRFPKGIIGVGIDDICTKGYSHTAVILHQFKGFRAVYGELRSSQSISYAGKSLTYRKENPKGFQTHLQKQEVVIFDDLITTGTSLKEAKKALESKGNRVLFALTLADARH